MTAGINDGPVIAWALGYGVDVCVVWAVVPGCGAPDDMARAAISKNNPRICALKGAQNAIFRVQSQRDHETTSRHRHTDNTKRQCLPRRADNSPTPKPLVVLSNRSMQMTNSRRHHL